MPSSVTCAPIFATTFAPAFSKLKVFVPVCPSRVLFELSPSIISSPWEPKILFISLILWWFGVAPTVTSL